MIDHLFVKDSFGRDRCVQQVAGGAGVRDCAYPEREHRAADSHDAFLGGVERSVDLHPESFRVATPPVSDKTDGDKLRWDLLPWEQVRDVVMVLTAAIKPPKSYPEHGWQGVPNPIPRYFAAALRHLFDRYVRGERLDPQLKLPHLACAVCSILFMMWHDDQQESK